MFKLLEPPPLMEIIWMDLPRVAGRWTSGGRLNRPSGGCLLAGYTNNSDERGVHVAQTDGVVV